MKIYLDFETRSEADLKKVGAWMYSRHPSTKVLCMAFAVDDQEVRLLAYQDQRAYVRWFQGVIQQEELVQFEAHNAFFEKCIIKNVLRLPVHEEQWSCSAALAASYALPRKLEHCGAALNLPIQKDSKSTVMKQLCKPRLPSKNNPDTWYIKEKYPEKYEELYSYCKTDVEAERAISKTLLAYGGLTPTERKVYLLDQEINCRGLFVDTEAIEKVCSLADTWRKDLETAIPGLTSNSVERSSQRDRVVNWAKETFNIEIDSYSKLSLECLIQKEIPAKLKAVLNIRLETSKTSVKKYEKMKICTDTDSRIRDVLLYHGATTGRWAGRLVQFQNIPAGISDIDIAVTDLKTKDINSLREMYGEPMEYFSNILRGMVIASPGKELIVSDYNAIETRVLAWISGCKDLLTAFAQGNDPYIQMAAQIFSIKEENIAKDSFERKVGKTSVLGCGYNMGSTRFRESCHIRGIEVSEELSDLAVKTYRKTFFEIPLFWKKTEAEAIAVCSGLELRSRWQLSEDKKFLFYQLPSGRKLAYYEPKISQIKTSWGTRKTGLTFTGINSQSKQAERQSTYGGKLVENIVQAIARDIMASAMLVIQKSQYKILLTVHDEIVAEIDEGSGNIGKFNKLMCSVPLWAKNCPLKAEGWIGKRYRKG